MSQHFASESIGPLGAVGGIVRVAPGRALLPGRIHPLIMAAVLFATIPAAKAQTQTQAPAPAQDPLMTLMLSQPKINLDAPVVASAAFDPPIVRPGEAAFFRIALNTLEDAVELPEKLDVPRGLDIRYSAKGQVLTSTPTGVEPRANFLYHVRASEPGIVVVPAFTIKANGKAVAVPATRLVVQEQVPVGTPRAERLQLEVAETNVFAGQAVRVDLVLLSSVSGPMQTMMLAQITGNGFVADQATAYQLFEARNSGRSNLMAFIYRTTLLPIASGKLTVKGKAFTFGTRPGPTVFNGTNVPLVNLPDYKLVDSDPVELSVRELPKEGLLPGFAGGVGDFAMDTPVLSTNLVRVGDPVKLRVNIRGKGNLTRLAPPPVPANGVWQVLPTANETRVGPPLAANVPGFSFTLIPLSSEIQTTPPIPFSFFDPVRQQYVDLTVPPAPIRVLPREGSAEGQALLQAAATLSESQSDATLGDIAAGPGRGALSLIPLQERPWFPAVQMLPGVGLLAVWLWDRRRRYLDQHPDIVLRRRARRALGRERSKLRRAARSSNAEAFAASAINCMRVACAPHFPAEARALVGRDILEVLNGDSQSSSNATVVRRLFEVVDAGRFHNESDRYAELLQLKPALDEVLDTLEVKLCR